ncbi:MAG TPA: NAD-dependent dihydropyrimidine dehydrogenase subunit PreA [Anaerolineae bacterium]|nr:NAD-dependent dihydropyrimidine dehydrogenase subunit PreA [Anaerolineae bacterium]
MADLSVEFAGLRLMNPFILASAPPTAKGEMIQRAFDAGWAGAVTKTIALEPARDVQPRLARLAAGNRIIGLENIELISQRSLDAWIKDLDEIKRRYPDQILFASLMGAVVREEWHSLVQQVQQTSVDGLELNFGCPHGMPEKGMGAAQGQDPVIAGDITRWVKEVATLPVMVKLTPNVTDIVEIAQACEEAGADAISAINTVSVLMGVDLDRLEPLPSVDGSTAFGGYSGPAVKPIGLRCIAQLAKGTNLPLSGIGGVASWEDAAEYILTGASTVQVCTAVMLRGYKIVGKMKNGLSDYLDEKGFGSVAEMRGHVLPKITAHEALDFAHKVVASIDEALCTKCGLCHTACLDGGWQAIEMQSREVYPRVRADKCDGCSLCTHVCPVEGCITLLVL